MTSSRWYQTVGIRIGMIFFWLLVVFAFLQLPQLLSLFQSQNSITIFTWTGILDSNYIKQFEKDTGIKLYINYYENNQELLSKLISTGGQGYDIIIPSDYMIPALASHGLIKPMDKSKLNFFNKIQPRLLNQYHDPGNLYSIPYFWSIYGIGVNLNYFHGKTPPATWGLIFDKKLVPDPIGMTNYVREAVLITAQYLFGSIDALREQSDRELVKQFLIENKSHVALYTDERAEDILLSESVPVAVGQSSNILRIKREHPHIDFIIPQEGSFLSIESIALSKKTTKDNLVYQFLNYLYTPEVIKHHSTLFATCPPINISLDNQLARFCVDSSNLKLDFFRSVVTEQQLNNIWISLMAY